MRSAEVRAEAPPVMQVRVRAPQLAEVLRVPLVRPIVFGRDESCDVVLPSPVVSRRHVTVLWQAAELCICDESSHGTRVNGAALRGEAVAVGPDAELEVGPYRLTLHVERGAERSSPPSRAPAPTESKVPAELRRKVRAELLESLDLLALDRAKMNPEVMRPTVTDALARIAARMRDGLPTGSALESLLAELCDEVLGLGPLEPLLADPSVSEIMVVDPSTIYVERGGKLGLSQACFTDDTAVRAVLERIVTPLGRRIDESTPVVDARLQDGSRVNAVIPPLALKGPTITIRKFPRNPLRMERLVAGGSLTEPMARFLTRCVMVRVNIVIAGGTGSGKTTLLNVLSGAIPEGERIVTIEDAAELQLHQRHVVSLESRPPNLEGQGAIPIRELVRNALRMRPDRIVVGECRGGEALDMLQAMNTGHDGSMTTTHANSPREALQRLETLCLMSGLDLPLSAIRRQIASSLNLLIQQMRFSDGTRKITHITEIAGLREDGEVELRDIFRFVPRGVTKDGTVRGEFLATGAIPGFVDRFLTCGVAEEGAW